MYIAGSSSHVYVNGYVIPQKEMVPMNDKDLISLGGNHTASEAYGQKRMFLYQCHAPTNWANSSSILDPNAGKCLDF